VRGKKPHFQVTAGVIRRRGWILISKRRKDGHMGGYWEFPGGKREPGETLRACLEREIEEELGFRVRAGEAFPEIHHEYDTRIITLYPFHCVPVEGRPRPLQCEAFRWVRARRLADFSFSPPDREIVRLIMETEKGIPPGKGIGRRGTDVLSEK